MVRRAAPFLYAALLAAFFASYYIDVRSAPPNTIVDYNVVVILLVLPTLLAGVLIGRWWAIALPLVAFPIAALMLVIGTLDDRYVDVAADRGGVLGLDWFGVSALVCAFTVPAAAFGAGLRVLGGVWERKWFARHANR